MEKKYAIYCMAAEANGDYYRRPRISQAFIGKYL